jgi:hypothetical protein
MDEVSVNFYYAGRLAQMLFDWKPELYGVSGHVKRSFDTRLKARGLIYLGSAAGMNAIWIADHVKR